MFLGNGHPGNRHASSVHIFRCGSGSGSAIDLMLLCAVRVVGFSLKHENIVKIFDFFETASSFCLTMEFAGMLCDKKCNVWLKSIGTKEHDFD